MIMILVCVSLMVLAATVSLPTGPVKSILGYAVIPFQKGINSIGTALDGATAGLQSRQALLEENQALQEQVDDLTAQNSQLTQDLDELDRLQELYALDQQYSEYDKVAAEVIAMDDENWFSTFTINRGTDDGIQVDCNVIAGSCRFPFYSFTIGNRLIEQLRAPAHEHRKRAGIKNNQKASPEKDHHRRRLLLGKCRQPPSRQIGIRSDLEVEQKIMHGAIGSGKTPIDGFNAALHRKKRRAYSLVKNLARSSQSREIKARVKLCGVRALIQPVVAQTDQMKQGSIQMLFIGQPLKLTRRQNAGIGPAA